MPPGEARFYRSPFLRDFWHLNVAMATSNNALVPDPDKEDILASKPTDWPLLRVGLRMCGWGDQQLKYYLVGTPVIWWGGTVSRLRKPQGLRRWTYNIPEEISWAFARKP